MVKARFINDVTNVDVRSETEPKRIKVGNITSHTTLNDRDLPDQHPTSAITGLEGALGDLSGGIDSNHQAISDINQTISSYGNIVTHNVNEFATASQGAKADTALQPNDNISELTNNAGYITIASVPTAVSQLTNDSGYQTGTQVANSISVETNNRELADNNLQSQIDAIVSSSDVFDIVGTYAELQAYNISTVPVNDIIKVLEDSTHAGAATYYRCVETGGVKSWSYIGSEGASYTKAEADNKFVPQTRTVNGKALSSNITLTANDVGALPSTTSIPTKTSDLTNDSGYITGITSSDVTTALGYTPYNSTNPAGYTSNVGTVTSVNNTQPDANGNVTITIPDTATWGNITGTLSNQTDLQNALNSKQDTISDLATIRSGAALGATAVQSSSLSTVATSGSYNDLSNKPTIPTVDQTYSALSTNAQSGVAVANAVAPKQDALVSGTNIKTINGNSLLGSGNITIETSSTPSVDGTTISYNSNDSLQTIAIKNKRDDSTLPIWQGTETQWNQGETTPWYYWQTTVTALWVSGGSLTSSTSWKCIAYGDGKFVVGSNSGKIAYSTDGGENWSELSSNSWTSITYGNGKFVAVSSSTSAYSTDGENWTIKYNSIPNASLRTVIFGNNLFVSIGYGLNIVAYSTDGENWDTSTMPSQQNWTSITYGNGKFVAVSRGSNIAAYSIDGENWTSSTMPSSLDWLWVTYGNGKFVAVAENSRVVAYSTDGENWNSSTMPSSQAWRCVAYGDGKFVAVVGNEFVSSSTSAYSTDGENWTSSTMPSKQKWMSISYGNGKFVAIPYNSSSTAIFSITYDKCYTSTENPTLSSVVYSNPEIQSTYTISSVSFGAITLSNNNTYYYNQSGNQYTYENIGTAHPDWLCFINGVGVKIGNTTIATA